jgi:DNA-binding XRE family transcriptional regulator
MATKTTHKWRDIRGKKLSPETLARVDREVKAELLSLELRELRELVGKTQEALAAQAELTQSQLSKFENRDDHLLSTLRRYVEALGGELEVVAVLGNKRVTLRGV